jgi:hypothetical protein
MATYRNPLHQMSLTTPTDFWNDSCSVQELTMRLRTVQLGPPQIPPSSTTCSRKRCIYGKTGCIKLS